MYFALMVWSYEICTFIVSQSIPQENPIMLFALMLFTKFVLPFYDLVVCTMLLFLPFSTYKVCTNKFYDIYAISKNKVCTKRTHVVCTNEFYNICPAHLQTLSLCLQVYFYNFALVIIHGLKIQKIVRLCTRFQIRELRGGRMN